MCVLIVEDELLIRMSAASILEEAGHEVEEAGTADAALRMIEANPKRYTCLFTDVRMPGKLDGLQLARIVCTSHSHIRVVVTSGDASIDDDEVLRDCAKFVHKPWTEADVLTVIH